VVGISIPTVGGAERRSVWGAVMAGSPYRVGENGPELIRPNGSGTVIQWDKAGGGEINLTIQNITVSDGSSKDDFVRLLKNTLREARRDLSVWYAG
jgi:hypothetical protein